MMLRRIGLLLLCTLVAGACRNRGDGESENGEGVNGGSGSSTGQGSGLVENPVSADAPQSAGVEVGEVSGDEECPSWQPAARPSAELPDTHDKEYLVELDRFKIDNNSGDPVETRNRINEAITWAVHNEYNHIILPKGRYLVGETTNDAYAAGIELPENMTLDLSGGAVIEMAENDRWNYCVIVANNNVTIRGGEVMGDRASHVFEDAEKTGHDEGHGICVWTALDRVLVEDMELHQLTGDGVLVLGRKETEELAEAPTTNVTIRRNNIHHNRRQGVSIVGGHNVVVEENHIHHIEGTAPQFGVDVEGAGRSDQDLLIYKNRFHDNAGGDVVTSTGRNLWIEENSMIQCGTDLDGHYDVEAPCELKEQVDGPIILWKESDSVVINNSIRMSMRTVNGFWGILGYTKRDGAIRENPVGNYIAGNTFYDAGIHMAHNMRTYFGENTLNEGTILAYLLGCTHLVENRINRVSGETYKLRNVAGVASGNILNRSEGAEPDEDRAIHFPMATDAPYRNSSPVFW